MFPHGVTLRRGGTKSVKPIYDQDCIEFGNCGCWILNGEFKTQREKMEKKIKKKKKEKI